MDRASSRSAGDFNLAKRDAVGAGRRRPRVIHVDRPCQSRPNACLNNLQEHDHRLVKKRIAPSLWLHSIDAALRTIAGYEAMTCKWLPVRQYAFATDPWPPRAGWLFRDRKRSAMVPKSTSLTFHFAVPHASAD